MLKSKKSDKISDGKSETKSGKKSNGKLFNLKSTDGNNKKSAPLGKVGDLAVYLGQSQKDIKKAQRLRYQVFYQEMNAKPDAKTAFLRRDRDIFDAVCSHLMVYDEADEKQSAKLIKSKKHELVGTYRLLTQEKADLFGGFYSESEYELEPLFADKQDLNFLELGRSCVLKPYRNKKTVELLWHGIWAFVRENNIDVMFGCASFPTTDPNSIANELSFLHHFASAGDDWKIKALDKYYVDMNIIEKDKIDQKRSLAALPPLIKGYLRLGAMVGDGAVVDHQFGTTDVMMILPVKNINPKYINYYGANGERYS